MSSEAIGCLALDEIDLASIQDRGETANSIAFPEQDILRLDCWTDASHWTQVGVGRTGHPDRRQATEARA
jgi:hypothetical protein